MDFINRLQTRARNFSRTGVVFLALFGGTPLFSRTFASYSLPTLGDKDVSLLRASLELGVHTDAEGGAILRLLREEQTGAGPVWHLDYSVKKENSSSGDPFWRHYFEKEGEFQLPLKEAMVLFGPRFASDLGPGQDWRFQSYAINQAKLRFGGTFAIVLDGWLQALEVQGLGELQRGDRLMLGVRGKTLGPSQRELTVLASELLELKALFSAWNSAEAYWVGSPKPRPVYPLSPRPQVGSPTALVPAEALQHAGWVEIGTVSGPEQLAVAEEENVSPFSEMGAWGPFLSSSERTRIYLPARLPDAASRLTYLRGLYRTHLAESGKCPRFLVHNLQQQLRDLFSGFSFLR